MDPHATQNQRAALKELHTWTTRFRKIARIALRDRPNLQGAFGIQRQKPRPSGPDEPEEQGGAES